MTLHPDPDRTLANGVVVETVLKARLLGLPVLRIHGVVLISPASGSRPSASAVAPARSSAEGTTRSSRRVLDARVADDGGDLAEARALLLENGRRLQQLG